MAGLLLLRQAGASTLLCASSSSDYAKGSSSVPSLSALGRQNGDRRAGRLQVSASLQSLVSDMSKKAPKGLFPPEPETYKGPKLKVAIIGAGLAGMSTAVELLEQGHEVDIYESRKFIGGKVGSFKDKNGNHIEMGLHVFFGCYNNLFRLLTKVGADNNLLVKDHIHTFINKGGNVGGGCRRRFQLELCVARKLLLTFLVALFYRVGLQISSWSTSARIECIYHHKSA